MTIANKLIIILLLFFAKSQVSQSQTYLTPIVGYEWNTAAPQPNYWNSLNFFKVLNTMPLQSYNFGIMAKRKLNPKSNLCTGLIYSKYHFDIYLGPFTGHNLFLNMKTSRIRALVGYELMFLKNLSISSNLSFNYLYGSKMWSKSDENLDFYPGNQTHLGLLIAANFLINENIVLRPHLEWGFWTLDGRSDLTAIRPTSGFGISFGYQFEL